MIKIIKGDLLSVKEGVVGQQVNCKGVMGAGLAKSIRAKYPSVYGNYLAIKKELGICQLVKVSDKLYVANLFGQDNYGRTGVYTSYNGLAKALESMFYFAKKNNLTVNLPYGIGCGLAGGKWELVEHIINVLSNKIEIEVYLYKL